MKHSITFGLRMRVRSAGLLVLLVMLYGAAHAQPAPGPDTGKPAQAATAASTATSAPITLAEIAVHAESAAADLRDIDAELAADDTVETVARELPALIREIDLRMRENARILAQRPSLDLLRTLERATDRQRDNLTRWTRELKQRIAQLDRDLARVSEIDKTWNETLKLAKASDSSPELVQRVRSLLTATERTRTAAEKERGQILRLQGRVAAQEFRVAEAIESIRQARENTLARVFEKDSPPVWSSELASRAGSQLALDSQESWSTQLATLQTYVARQWGRFPVHGALFALLAAGLFWMRRRAAGWVEKEPELQRVAAVFALPLATAFVLSLIGSRWIYPQAPRLLWVIVGAAALLPTVVVLRRLLAPRLWPILYAVVAFYFVDQVRAVTASMVLIPRLVFLTETLAGALFLLWFLRSERTADGNQAPPTEARSRKTVRITAQLACGLFACAAVANAAGYVTLANLIGNAVLRSAYLGVILYTIVAILDGFVMIALRVRPLTLLGMVERHRELLRRRIRFVLGLSALALWALFVLDRLALREKFIQGAQEALGTEVPIGSISISPGDVIAFGLTVWASFLVSRFVRFVLDEEIYPHAHLQRGLPYAISNTLHYAILVAGFLLAVAALGFDMTKFTILAGAFTVGVGFGLQAIFNNFVSGMILLFERPIQIGDMIQLDDNTAGIVERIGIRASVVRTSAGSEIIVPNSKLISERVINWTLSDRQRGMELPVSVAHGADPKRVIAVMERVAADYPTVRKDPPPEALLVKLGPDWMGFELRASTDRVEDWMKVRSDLAVAISEALAAEKIALK